MFLESAYSRPSDLPTKCGCTASLFLSVLQYMKEPWSCRDGWAILIFWHAYCVTHGEIWADMSRHEMIVPWVSCGGASSSRRSNGMPANLMVVKWWLLHAVLHGFIMGRSWFDLVGREVGLTIRHYLMKGEFRGWWRKMAPKDFFYTYVGTSTILCNPEEMNIISLRRSTPWKTSPPSPPPSSRDSLTVFGQ